MFEKKNRINKAVFESEREYQLLQDALSKKNNVLEEYETGSMSELACEIFSRRVVNNHPDLDISDCIQIKWTDNARVCTYYYRISSKKIENKKELK